MKQDTLVQILGILILAGLAIFYNPLSADFQGRIIFFGVVIAIVLFFIIFDLYKKIENNETKIRLFNQKANILERVKNLENYMNSTMKKRGIMDPRIIWLLVILLLIYLYIRSQSG